MRQAQTRIILNINIEEGSQIKLHFALGGSVSELKAIQFFLKKKQGFSFFPISLKNVFFLKVMVQSDLRFISHPQILPFTEWTSKPVISLSMF